MAQPALPKVPQPGTRRVACRPGGGDPARSLRSGCLGPMPGLALNESLSSVVSVIMKSMNRAVILLLWAYSNWPVSSQVPPPEATPADKDALRPAAFPVRFAAGRISTPEHGCPTFSPDGKAVYFARHTPAPSTLMESHFRGGGWTTPEPLRSPARTRDASTTEPRRSRPMGRSCFSRRRDPTANGRRSGPCELGRTARRPQPHHERALADCKSERCQAQFSLNVEKSTTMSHARSGGLDRSSPARTGV